MKWLVVAHGLTMLAIMLSIVIPTLNANSRLVDMLATITPARTAGLVEQIVVSDGGSTDETCETARSSGAEIIDTARGRGAQLAAGAEQARGNWLLFLHADTQLEPGWYEEVETFIRQQEDNGSNGQAGVFQFKLDDESSKARILEWVVRLRCALLNLPYGDQGLVISRKLYDRVGGFADIPLMEDVDIVRRIGKRRLHYFNHYALTSAVRYRREGYLKRMGRNATCIAMYFAGVPPKRILSFYQ